MKRQRGLMKDYLLVRLHRRPAREKERKGEDIVYNVGGKARVKGHLWAQRTTTLTAPETRSRTSG